MKYVATVCLAFAMFPGLQLATACPGQAHKDIENPRGRLRQFEQPKARHQAFSGNKGSGELKTAAEECFLYQKMDFEKDIPCLASLVNGYDALPKRIKYVTTSRKGKDLRLAVHIVGTGKHDCVLVCLPGVMSDHREWRFVAGALASDYDFWLIDPPGCGKSDAPDPKSLGPDGYGASAMADRELQAIAECLKERDPSVRVALVGHSLGALVALRAVADPNLRARHAEVVQKFHGLVLFAPPDVVMNKPDPHFLAMSKGMGAKIGVARGLGVMRDFVAKYLVESSTNVRCIPREQVDSAVEIFGDPARRHAFQAMLQQALPFYTPENVPNWVEMHRIEGWYSNVNVPVRLIWGDCDQTIPLAMGYKIAAQLPNAKLSIVPDCMHSPNLECPAECAKILRQTELSLRNGGTRNNVVSSQ